MSSATIVQVAEDAAKHVILSGQETIRHDDIQQAISRIYRIRHLGGQAGASKR
jgi:histone H3/H4